MEDIKVRFIDELLAKPPELIASIWILDRIPTLFSQNTETYAAWRHELAGGLGVDPSSIVITGSCAFGISLNPYKNYRFFDSTSDIDVAVVSEYHFNEAWRSLRNLGSEIHKLSQPAKQSVKDHVGKYIYWGTIATDKILHILPFAKSWNEILGIMQKNHLRKVGLSMREFIVTSIASELTKSII